jgi:isochorismate pyruvate lyase
MESQDLKIKTPDQCLSMTDLRVEIDRLDRKLVGLLSERQRYIERAAEIKSHRRDIRDEGRIADILTKISAEARKAGLNPDLARAVWRELIERSIALEMGRFEDRSASASDNS